MPNGLFGTSGIRGDASELFTNQFCFDLGRTFSKFLDKHKQTGAVAVGMDPRGSSPRIKDAFEAGLSYEGKEIYDEGATPVPSMCYILQLSDFITGSVMITGSHIKAYLNGIKFFAFDGEILTEHEREIEKIYSEVKEKIKYRKSKAFIINENKATEEYKNLLLSLAKGRYPRWKVVADPGDGAQSDVMPIVLKQLGIDIIEINSTLQGEFFARDTENEPDFEPLKEKVKQAGADFGIAWDSDGDRCIFIGKGGIFIPGDYTASIVARDVSSEKIITPVATSQVVDHIGKKIVRTNVGSPFVIEAMKKNGSKFGFEANGGGVSAEIMYTRDGGTTTIKFLNILAKSGKTIEELVGELPKFYLSKTKVDYQWGQKDEILKAAKDHFNGKVDETDGLKIWISDSTWMLFRSSMNAPEFRIFAESENKETSEKLLAEGLELVNNIIKK